MVFVQAQRVNATTVRFARGVLTGNEADIEQRLQVGLDQRLQGLFQVRRVALQFGGGATRQAEEFDVAQGYFLAGLDALRFLQTPATKS